MLRLSSLPTLVPSPRRWLAQALVPAAAALLVACGGGGGGGGTSPTDQVSGPPATAANLAGAATDASASARVAVASADAAAARARSLSGVSALFGQPVGSAPVQVAGLSRRAQIQAVTTSPCTDFFDAPCSGSIVVDTNVPDNATSVGVNDFADIRFQSASGLLAGSQVSLSGRMRLDFLAPLNLNSARFTGLNVLLTLDGFSGTVNGAPFGPLSDVGQLQIDANGISTITAGGVRYQGLSGFTNSGTDSYRIGSGSVRTGHWLDANGYVDVNLTGWQVASGRPTPGSRATLTGAQGSIDVTVASSSSQTVTYTVSITVNGVASQFIVTATYPAGGGAPSYNAVGA